MIVSREIILHDKSWDQLLAEDRARVVAELRREMELLNRRVRAVEARLKNAQT